MEYYGSEKPKKEKKKQSAFQDQDVTIQSGFSKKRKIRKFRPKLSLSLAILFILAGISMIAVGVYFATQWNGGSPWFIGLIMPGALLFFFGIVLLVLTLAMINAFKRSAALQAQQNEYDISGEDISSSHSVDLRCKKCGALNDNKSKFCDQCGEPLSRICPRCNKENPSTSVYCEQCGGKLR